MTAQLTTVEAGGTIAGGTNAGAQAQALARAVAAVNTTMGQITNLKEAEGLSDTVVDAIGILENAWEELGEVRLGNAGNTGTAVSAIPDANTAIQNVTQAQVDTLREVDNIDTENKWNNYRR